MRHFLAPAPILRLPGGVVDPAAPALLVAPTSRVEGRASRVLGTGARAVAVAAIAAPAQGKLPSTGRPGADHQAERVHRSSRARREELDIREEVCELWRPGIELNRVLRGLARVVRRGRALRTLTLSAPWWDPVYPISAGRGNRLPSALAVGCSDLRPFQWSTTSPGLHAQPHSEGPRAPDPAFPRCLPSLAPPSVRRRRL